jgi:alginate O-acetyltransferase complex protein AlgJ
MTNGSRIRTIADWLVIAMFLGAIGLPLAGSFLTRRFNRAANDLRPLAPAPQFRLDRQMIYTYLPEFENYWNDHFAFRGTLIRALNIAKVRWLHVSTSAHVLLGRASWLFYTAYAPGTNYHGVRPFTTEELDRWQRVLELRRAWLERRGCRYLVFIPPDKQTIYPEYLDPSYRSPHAQSRLDQLVAHLRGHGSKVEILDIRQPMRAVKSRERLYHRTDSHWNDRGAFIGYQHLVGALSAWFPNVQPAPRSVFEETASQKPGGDLATMVDLAERDREEWLSLVPKSPLRASPKKADVAWPVGADFPLGHPFARECDDPRLPRAVMFHDSFYVALDPFLSEHFRRIAYVWTDDFYPEVVEREKPQVVIQEMLERKLGYVTPKGIEE